MGAGRLYEWECLHLGDWTLRWSGNGASCEPNKNVIVLNAKLSTGTKCSTYTLLAIGECLVGKPDDRSGQFLLELMELRCDNVSTAFAPQLTTKEWRAVSVATPSPTSSSTGAQRGMDRRWRVQRETTVRAALES